MAILPEETSLIQKYLAPMAAPAGLNLQDDAACLSPSPGMDLVITTDTIVENIHFLSSDTPFQIAIKAITVNLSDLVAKGAIPVGYQIALSLPQKPSEKWLKEFSSGLGEQIHGKLLGGDLTLSNGGPLTISVTAIGEVPAGKMVRRMGANLGDSIFVCGQIGTKAIGLKCAQDLPWAKRVGLSTTEIDDLVNEYAAPRVAFADIYADCIQRHAHAALDISDGLVIDLERLCAASEVGAQVNVDNIPFSPTIEKLLKSQAITFVDLITGGDDYVQLFTAPSTLANEFARASTANFWEIGKIVEMSQGVTFLQSDGSPLLLEGRSGYDHFSQSDSKAK